MFLVHGVDREGQAVLRKKLRRGHVLKFFGTLPPCLVGMEGCGSAHYWARALGAQGYQVRLIPPQSVRPFLKTNKHDAADTEALAEALVRPTMRFAPPQERGPTSGADAPSVTRAPGQTTHHAHQCRTRALQ